MLDVLIKNARIYDGTGGEAFSGDIGIQGDTITALGGSLGEEAAVVIDAAGRAATPGFIDPHCHVDTTLPLAPGMDAYLRQGVTTVVAGNCGHAIAPMGEEVYRGPILDSRLADRIDPNYFSDIPLLFPREAAAKALKEVHGIDAAWRSLGEFMAACDKLPPGGNVALLAGYSAIRSAVMGMDCERPATETELDKLAALTEECMAAGAFGLSTGRDPQYVPGPSASLPEMARALDIVKGHGGIFASHTYNVSPEGKFDRMGGYREMIDLGMEAGVRMQVSHAHVMGMAETAAEGVKAAEATIACFEEYRAKGADLTFDVIPSPHCADITVPYFAFFIKPLVLLSGSRAHLAENLRVPDFRKMVHCLVDNGMLPMLDERSPRFRLYPFHVERHRNPAWAGKSFAACAKALGCSMLDAMMTLFAEDPDMAAGMSGAHLEGAVDLLCRHPLAMPCSDGMSYAADYNLSAPEIPVYPNAMNVSFIPRYLLRYGQEDFAGAVHRASGMVAERFGIEKRGVLKVGNFADVVLLDREKLRSHDEEDPLRAPDGVEYVIVNGKICVEKGALLRKDAGRMLRRGSVT